MKDLRTDGTSSPLDDGDDDDDDDDDYEDEDNDCFIYSFIHLFIH